MNPICYKKGYKYQLVEKYEATIPILPAKGIPLGRGYIALSADGNLVLKKGYAWDGPSGPTMDTLNFMCGSLVHDALYQLMRENKLERAVYRKPADELLRAMCRADGMSAVRAWFVYRAVRWFANSATDPENKKQVCGAPVSLKTIRPISDTD